MINKLIKLSNHLDAKGLTKEADYLDAVIIKNAAQPTPITTEEAKTMCKRNRTFAVELKEANDKLSEAQRLVSILQYLDKNMDTSRQDWCHDLLRYAEREEQHQQEHMRQQQEHMRQREEYDQMRERMWGEY